MTDCQPTKVTNRNSQATIHRFARPRPAIRHARSATTRMARFPAKVLLTVQREQSKLALLYEEDVGRDTKNTSACLGWVASLAAPGVVDGPFAWNGALRGL